MFSIFCCVSLFRSHTPQGLRRESFHVVPEGGGRAETQGPGHLTNAEERSQTALSRPHEW